MRISTKYEKFDILLVNFPFSNLAQTKIRPAVVIKELEGDNIIFCQITTKKRGIIKYEIPLNKSQCEGDIRFNSKVHIDMIFTLHESLVSRKIGFIKDERVKKEIDFKLKELFFN
ncbi:MAG: type II toxin-antitoxin system PemK/MazF family toxin [Nanoarchaeota archaeon]